MIPLPGGQHLDATWSPDGSQIAFVSNMDGGDLDLYVMDSNGENIKQVTNMLGDEHAPSWSPDGQAIAFNRIDWTQPTGSNESVHIQELAD